MLADDLSPTTRTQARKAPLRRERALFHFLTHDGVDDELAGEQAIRPAVVNRKGLGGTGRREPTQARMMSLIHAASRTST